MLSSLQHSSVRQNQQKTVRISSSMDSVQWRVPQLWRSHTNLASRSTHYITDFYSWWCVVWVSAVMSQGMVSEVRVVGNINEMLLITVKLLDAEFVMVRWHWLTNNIQKNTCSLMTLTSMFQNSVTCEIADFYSSFLSSVILAMTTLSTFHHQHNMMVFM